MTATDTDVVVGTYEEPDTSSVENFLAEEMRLAHVIAPSDNKTICYVLGNGPELTASDIVTYARIHRIFVIALCGYKFIPKHNPEKYDACEACIEEANRRIANGE